MKVTCINTDYKYFDKGRNEVTPTADEKLMYSLYGLPDGMDMVGTDKVMVVYTISTKQEWIKLYNMANSNNFSKVIIQ